MDIDISIRLAAFNWLRDQAQIYGDVLPRAILEKGLKVRHIKNEQRIYNFRNQTYS